jgi:hypothetical protein
LKSKLKRRLTYPAGGICYGVQTEATASVGRNEDGSRNRLRIDPQRPGACRTNARRAAAKPRRGPKKQQTREAPPIIIEG